MSSSTRLLMSAALILFSAGYAVLIAQDPEIASAIASGYVAVLLSLVIILNLWKKP